MVFPMRMARNFNLLAITDSIRKANNRKHGRLLCQDLYSDWGIVADISATGMRVIGSKKPPKKPGAIEFTLFLPEGALRVEGEVVWKKKAGFFKREYGIRFTKVNPDAAAALARLARAVVYNETIRPELNEYRKAN